MDDVSAEVYDGLNRLAARKARYRGFLKELIEFADAEIARLEHPEVKGSKA